MPKVSVIIPLYNGSRYIVETIKSVLNQTYKNYEIIVVDDGSADNSKKILDEFTGKIKYIYQSNHGISNARNKAIEASSGEYIALLDQDDIWYPEKLEKQVEVMEKSNNLGLIYADCHYINEKDEIISRVFENQKYYSGKIFENLIMDNFIPIPTVLIRKSVLDKVGLFLEKYSFAEEYALFVRIAKDYDIGFINEVLAGYRIHGGNLSKNKEKSIEENIRLKEEIISTYKKETFMIEKDLKVKLAKLYYEAGHIYRRLKKNKIAKEKFLKSIEVSKYSYKQFFYYFLTLIL